MSLDTRTTTAGAGAPLIDLDHIVVEFGHGRNRFRAVDDVSLTIRKGSIYGIIGFSGAGKSTLVRTMNVLQRPTSGTVTFNGADIGALSESRLLPLRRKIAMIFQHFNLMPSRTVLDNVTLPLIHEKISKRDARAKAMHLLELVGIADKAKAYPRQLSGGQQQRVAIARALIGDPEVLLCDEATSALDPRTTRSILALLKDLNERLGLTIVLITHQMQVVKDICTDLAVMSHGRVVDSGSILDVFDHPSSELTREFIYTSGNMNKGITLMQTHPLFAREREAGHVYLLSSVGSGAEETLMADAHDRFGVTGNIMFGNVDVIHNTPVGMILVSLDGPDAAIDNALAYFKSVGVGATPLAELHVNESEENETPAADAATASERGDDNE
ncbi:methionine ABC transporter ATP-binding protein [Bifidobacterium leontopitheci]|uniref:ABC transporter ATP-binding protein n=1 Tax=Bifidobacterium leontopitheci TaxID=2650774 RepID=A0A6I1GFA6_9BIFI|nr:methionine ABC transporter ATP-binding protein [Bifidobacterium leontopitheci]KAB7790320.1 ABC transporter ATP-binding protein [Bifidobacterium leontopitheci]